MGSPAQKDRVDFDAAKELSVTEFLERQLGVSAAKVGSKLRMDSCPNCGDSNKGSHKLSISNDDRAWRCFSCGEGGSILDAAMQLWKCEIVEAAQQLLGIRDDFKATAKPKIDRQQAEAEERAKTALMRQAFTKIQQATAAFADEPVPLNYLVNDRKIPLSLVREAQARGMVGFLPSDSNRAFDVLLSAVGEDLLRKTDLWKPDKRMPGIAYNRPLVFFLPGLSSAEFRLAMREVPEDWTKSIRYGTLEYPYWWQGAEGNRDCMVVEGMIDLLSMVALGFKGHVMGLTGCNTFIPEWFPRAAKRHNLARYAIGLDNDVQSEKNPGQKWAKILQREITAMGIPSFIKAPAQGDINDMLRARS